MGCRDERGRVPVREGLRGLLRRDRRAHAKRVARIPILSEEGCELRRPIADSLRDGIHQLRARKGNVNDRILSFFHGRNVAVLAYALGKEDVVPDADIDRAREARDLARLRSEWQIHEA